MVSTRETSSVEQFSKGPGFGDQRPRGVAPVTFLPDPEPEPRQFAVVSVDDHLFEPPDLFRRRLGDSFGDAVPRLVRREDRADFWLIDGAEVAITMGNAVAGRPQQEWRAGPIGFDEVRRGVYDVEHRVRDMDATGVWASLGFPSMPWGFAGQTFSRMRDPQVGQACLRAYNDWLVEDWAGAAPDRFIVSALTWLGDIEGAVQEVYRNAERGVPSVSFSENPDLLGLPSLHSGAWDPFFAACEETGTVINLHVGSGSWTPVPSSDSPPASIGTLFPATTMFAAVEWIWSQVFLRFPGLRVAMSEGGLGWVLMLADRLENMGRYLDTYRSWPTTGPTPREVLLTNFRFCALYDPIALQCIEAIGVDSVMMEVDYPHMDSLWPDVQRLMGEQLRGLELDVVRRVTYGNACALYRHPLPPPGWADTVPASVAAQTVTS
jgi:predicted TIM-barrel fold metal-dependent hydrolase